MGFSVNKLKTSNILRLQFPETCSLGSCKTSSLLSNDSALYGRFKLQMKNFPLLYHLEILIWMHTLLWNIPIHHMHIWYSKCHSHIVSSMSQNLCPNLKPVRVFSSLRARANKPKPSIRIYTRVFIN
jgi:hypothetical protein